MNVFFGEEFDSRNSLSIKGEKNSSKKEIEIELIFDTKPPIKVISAINSCDVIEEKYISDEHQQYNAEESFKKSTPSNQESKKINLKIAKGSKKTQNKKEDNSLVAALSLDRIAKYSSSFEDFVKNVAMYFELDKRSETFQKWVICASNAEIISWKVIDEELSKFGKVRYNTSNDRHACSKKIADKLEVQKINLISLFKSLKKYKDFNYETETAEGTEDSSKNFQKRVRMECMPEIEDFEEKLGRIDKTLAIENRIKYVLDMMGFETNTKITSDAKKNILMLANKAIMLREISIEKAFLEVPDIANKSNETLISFSQGINDFIRQYDAEKKVKVLEFLTDLQKVILTNEEYKKIMESKN